MTRAQLVQMRVPPELLARVDAAAEEAGVTRTRWALDAFEAQLTAQYDHLSREPVATRTSNGGRSVATAGGKCPHPVTRRIGPDCAVCGAKVGR